MPGRENIARIRNEERTWLPDAMPAGRNRRVRADALEEDRGFLVAARDMALVRTTNRFPQDRPDT